MVEKNITHGDQDDELIYVNETSAGQIDRKIRFIRNLPEVGLRLGVAATLIYGSVQIGKDFVSPMIENYVDQITIGSDSPARYEYDREESTDGLIQSYKEQYGEDLSSGRIQELLQSDYFNTRTTLSETIGYFIRTQYDDTTKEYISQQRFSLVMDGVKMLQNYFGMESIKINEEKGTVKLPDTERELSLSDPFDLILIDQFTIYSMDAMTNKLDANSDESQKKADDIKWLVNNENLNIEIVNDSAFVFEDDSLATISRLGQILERKGITSIPPIKIVSYLGGKAAGYYLRPIINGEKGDQIWSVNENVDSIVVHEFGHYISFSSNEYGLNKFNNVIIAQQEELSQKGFNGAGEVAFVTPYAKTNDKEDYAETFEMYYDDGDWFRFQLKRLANTSRADYYVLLEKYNFMKDFFGGEEFLNNGEKFAPSDGEIYVISDDDPHGRTIALRETPENIGSSNITVKDGDAVQIVGAPISAWSSFFETERMHYNVTVERDGQLLSGWITDLWLGEKIEINTATK